MGELVQVKADIPRHLKRRAFAAFAWREIRFNQWLRVQLERWLAEIEGEQVAQCEGGSPYAEAIQAPNQD